MGREEVAVSCPGTGSRPPAAQPSSELAGSEQNERKTVREKTIEPARLRNVISKTSTIRAKKLLK
jgi:hypothetical protein